MLFAVPISGVIGVTSIWQNIGELTNTGFETTLSADIIKNKDLTWTFDANLSTNTNKIKKLYSGRDQIIEGDGIAGSTNTLLRPGLSADTYYLREWAGVDPDTGAPQWLTTDANAIASSQRTMPRPTKWHSTNGPHPTSSVVSPPH